MICHFFIVYNGTIISLIISLLSCKHKLFSILCLQSFMIIIYCSINYKGAIDMLVVAS